jgi:ribose 5-phosphate isomerase B
MTALKPLVIASDHAGIALKAALIRQCTADGISIRDLGTHSTDSVDYPDFARSVAEAIVQGEAERGILICGTGIGMSMAANRYPHIRAALCHTAQTAALCREHNNANILVLGARIIDEATALKCTELFLSTPFAAGRHQDRINKFDSL